MRALNALVKLITKLLLLAMVLLAPYVGVFYYVQHITEVERHLNPEKVVDTANPEFRLMQFKFEDHNLESFLKVVQKMYDEHPVIDELDTALIVSAGMAKQAGDGNYKYIYTYQPWYLQVLGLYERKNIYWSLRFNIDERGHYLGIDYRLGDAWSYWPYDDVETVLAHYPPEQRAAKRQQLEAVK